MTRRTARVPRIRQEQPVDEDRGDPDVDDGRETDLVDDRLDGLRHRGQSVRQARGADSRGSSGMRVLTSARRRSRAGPLSVSSTYRSRITSLSAAAVSQPWSRSSSASARWRSGSAGAIVSRAGSCRRRRRAVPRGGSRRRVEDHLADHAGIPGLDGRLDGDRQGPGIQRREGAAPRRRPTGVRAGDPVLGRRTLGSGSASVPPSVRSARANCSLPPRSPSTSASSATSASRRRRRARDAAKPEGPAGGVAGVRQAPSDSWVSATGRARRRPRPAGRRRSRRRPGRPGSPRRGRQPERFAEGGHGLVVDGRAGGGAGPCWRVAAGGRGRGWRLRRRRPRPPRATPHGRDVANRRALLQALVASVLRSIHPS